MAQKKSSGKGSDTAMEVVQTPEQKALAQAKRERTTNLARLGFAALRAAVENKEIGSKVIEARLVQKEELFNRPFIVVGYDERIGDYVKDGIKGPYVSVEVVLDNDEMVVFNTGAAGIRKALLETPPTGFPIVCMGGLRVSKFDYTDETTGDTMPAETYYFAGSIDPSKPIGRGLTNGQTNLNV